MSNDIPKIHGSYVLVEPQPIEEKTKGGIIKPDTYIEDVKYLQNVGKVVSMGEMAYEEIRQGENRFGKTKWCKVGDYVVWKKMNGNKIMYKGKPYVILFDDEIMMTVENPNDIKVDANLIKY